jgi:hypothetical protein
MNNLDYLIMTHTRKMMREDQVQLTFHEAKNKYFETTSIISLLKSMKIDDMYRFVNESKLLNTSEKEEILLTFL